MTSITKRLLLQHRLSPIGFLAAVVLFVVGCSSSSVTDTPTVLPTNTPLPAQPTAIPTQPLDMSLTPQPTLASESALVSIRERGELRVGILYSYEPFSWLETNGKVSGYEVELLQRVAEEWGVEVSFVQVTRQSRYRMLISGQVDLIAGAVPHTRSSEEFGEYTLTTFKSGNVILVREDSGIESSHNLGGGQVGVFDVDDSGIASLMTQSGIVQTDLREYPSLADASADLEQGVINALVGRREHMMFAASSLPETRIIDEFISYEPYAFAAGPGDTPLRDLLNLTLYELSASGAISEIYSSFFYGYPPDVDAVLTGDPAYSFDSFPAAVTVRPSIVARIESGDAIRVAGLSLIEEPARFDGQPIVDGFNRAVINEMARRWNVPVVESPGGAGEATIGQLQSGEVDVVVGVIPQMSLFGATTLSQPYYVRGIRLIHMFDVNVAGVLDLELRPTVIVEPVDISRDLIEDNNQAPDIRESPTFADAYDSLVGRGVFALVGDEFSLYLMYQEDENIVIDPELYRPTAYTLGLPPNDPLFEVLVNITLQDMELDGTLQQLREQYFLPYLPEGELLEKFTAEVWPE